MGKPRAGNGLSVHVEQSATRPSDTTEVDGATIAHVPGLLTFSTVNAIRRCIGTFQKTPATTSRRTDLGSGVERSAVRLTDMTSPYTFYVGPGRPRLRINTWGELSAAADAGALLETQWVELKKDVPKGNAANLELARDLASLSVEGGVLLVGVSDKLEDASGLLGVTDIEPLRDRISQVATGRVTPPLNIDLVPVSNPTNPDRPLLMVVVPASADAPHMAGEKYWGRSATGKRPLTDAETQRLWVQRHRHREDFQQQLVAMTEQFDPVSPAQRRFGHLYLYARPATAPTSSVTDALSQYRPHAWIQESLTFTPESGPALSLLEHRVPHADGIAVGTWAFRHPGEVGDRFEELLLLLLVDDHGGLRLVSGQGTRAWTWQGDDLCIFPNYAMELTHQTLHLAGSVLNTNTGYHGTWDVGIHMTG